MSSKIIDLSTDLRAKFWSLWRRRRRSLVLPEDLSRMSPEKAYRLGHRQGFWEGALDASKVFASLGDHSEGEDM